MPRVALHIVLVGRHREVFGVIELVRQRHHARGGEWRGRNVRGGAGNVVRVRCWGGRIEERE